MTSIAAMSDRMVRSRISLIADIEGLALVTPNGEWMSYIDLDVAGHVMEWRWLGGMILVMVAKIVWRGQRVILRWTEVIIVFSSYVFVHHDGGG